MAEIMARHRMHTRAKRITFGILDSWLWLVNGKHPGNIESKVNVTISPIAYSFSDETFLNHGSGIGKMELKNMASRLYVKPNRKAVPEVGPKLIGRNIKVLCIDGHSFRQLVA